MARLPHRRIPYDGQTTAWFATSSLGSLRGHRPTRHSPSDPASPRRACQGVRSAMPPRYLAFEEVKVCLQIPKLDPSAPHFIRSRALDTAVLDAHARCQALEQHVRPKAVEPCRPPAGAEPVLVGRLDQPAAFDQPAKILL